MKNIVAVHRSLYKKQMRSLSVAIVMASCLGLSTLVTSCEYQEIVDFPYPDALIYLPTAAEGNKTNGVYVVEESASTKWVSPTPGQPLRYDVNKNEKQFIVPLGVYRSGFGDRISGRFDVDITVNTDTIAKLINAGTLVDVELLPVNALSVPQSVLLQGGKNDAPFDLLVDLDFLKANDTIRYATGITIANSAGGVNPALSTAIIVIDAKVTVPVAAFLPQLDGSTTDTYNFDNSSLYWDFFSGEKPFSWNFGDGSSVSNDISPKHKYASPGKYTVTLSVKGISGDVATASQEITVE